MTLDETINSGQTGHLSDHDVLHEFHNDYLVDQSGHRFVTKTGSNTADGLTWQTAVDTIGKAQSVDGHAAKIFLGPGIFDIKTTIELADGQYIIGVGPHGTFGTKLLAHADLGTDPMMANATGNLTSGGIFDMQMRGTGDSNGGVGIYITTPTLADHYMLHNLNIQQFTSHGIHFDLTTGIAGNPMDFGILNFFSNGAGGTGDGMRIERMNRSIYHFSYIGGDNNADSLVHFEGMNQFVHVRIDQIKAERTTDGNHNDIITVANASAPGSLSIGSFWVLHTVTGGTNPNALIRETGGSGLRWDIGLAFIEETGSNKYVYGYDDGNSANRVVLAAFINRPWSAYVNGQGFRRGVLRLAQANTPEGADNGPVGSIFQRTNGGDGTSLYVKTSGTGNTGWRGVNGIAPETDAGRPSASSVPEGYEIFNTDDGFPNWSDGTNWVDATGTIT